MEAQYNKHEIDFLIEGFTHGFDIGYRGQTQDIQRESPNLKLRVGSERVLWNKVMKEVKLGRFAGPFKSPPYKDYIQSPIGLVPKDNGDTRLIFHLSFPKQWSSINSETPEEFCTVNYPDFSEAIMRCIEESGSDNHPVVIAKSDMSSAFRHLGLNPEQFCLLLMKAKSPLDGLTYYFVEKALSFRASISCSHFQRFSNSVAHLVRHRTHKKPINYMDDYFFIDRLSSLCNRQVQTFIDICNEIKFPVSLEKTFWATSVLVFLGLMIDTIGKFISIPVDKIQKALVMIDNMTKAKKAMINDL